MTEKPRAEGTSVLWVAAVVAVVLLVIVLLTTGDIKSDERYTRSCMDSVVTPDPEAIDYDTQSLEFMSEVRKCMRG